MNAVTDSRVTAAIAAARAALELAVSKGIFSGELTPSSIWILSCEMTSGDPKFCYDDERFSYDDERAKSVIAKAVAGDVEANAALREVARRKLREGLPPNLAQYIASLLADDWKPPDGRGHPPNHARNLFIHAAVETIKAHGFDVMRNTATREHESACSIVAAALAELGIVLSEKSIERIWKEIQRGILSSPIGANR
jgi:hypothetical protein